MINVGKKILLIDDDPGILEVLSDLLSFEYFSVVTASSATEAMAQIKSNDDICLILCDINMPGKSGLEFLADHLRQNDLVPPVTMLTANSDKERLIEALRLGALDYITKPFDSADLVARVYKLSEIGTKLVELKRTNDNSPERQRTQKMANLLRLKNNKDTKKKAS